MAKSFKDSINYLVYGMRYGAPDRFERFILYFSLKDILNTPAISGRNDGLVVLSMVSHKDVLMYLLAVKTLDINLRRGRFEVIDDGTLNKQDIQIIQSHVQGVRFRTFQEINNTKCPLKGCWERLLYAAELSQNEQVLVLDSDIVVQGDLQEINRCIDQNQNFIMGAGQDIGPMMDIWKKESIKNTNLDASAVHVQTYVDIHLNLIPNFENLKYLKGSGGFNSFAKGIITRQIVEDWSIKLEGVFGPRWHCWGTEQIMICFLLANYGHSVVLQEPKYGLYYAGDKNYDVMLVIHFIGSHRYKKGYYAQSAKRSINELRNGKGGHTT
jgi:hypothetical protein